MTSTSPEPIVVDQLAYAYPDGRSALVDVSLDVPAGSAVAIVGPNGAGKTTLLMCLAGVLTPSRGRLRVGPLDPTQGGDRKRLPELLGVLFQDSDDQLFCATVREDVAFGLLNQGRSWAEAMPVVDAVLADLGLAELADRSPHRLSSGEKRKVALAGLLAVQPAVLLLDEPTAGLDPRGRRQLTQCLERPPQTKLLAPHDFDLILDLCPRSVLLDEGRLWADESTSTLLARGDFLAAHGLEPPRTWATFSQPGTPPQSSA
ncbi:MAG TPA: energy-coupling factor ABC transporter ATP-binding protein [Gemmatales bacterium]|nr:energy-coupling factor ABC transporter ATP-binding protein [Gemmatales bacterium]